MTRLPFLREQLTAKERSTKVALRPMLAQLLVGADLAHFAVADSGPVPFDMPSPVGAAFVHAPCFPATSVFAVVLVTSAT